MDRSMKGETFPRLTLRHCSLMSNSVKCLKFNFIAMWKCNEICFISLSNQQNKTNPHQQEKLIYRLFSFDLGRNCLNAVHTSLLRNVLIQQKKKKKKKNLSRRRSSVCLESVNLFAFALSQPAPTHCFNSSRLRRTKQYLAASKYCV